MLELIVRKKLKTDLLRLLAKEIIIVKTNSRVYNMLAKEYAFRANLAKIRQVVWTFELQVCKNILFFINPVKGTILGMGCILNRREHRGLF